MVSCMAVPLNHRPAAPHIYAVPRLRRPAGLRRLVPLAALAFFFAAAQPILPQAPKPSQDEVEAVYLYDFARFVRWPPAGPGANLELCVAAPASYSDALSRIVQGERVNGRAAVVHSIRRPAEEAGCDILFIDRSMKDSLNGLLDESRGKPVLTVSDSPGFLDRGGMIQFLLVNDRVRFAVNMFQATQSGISLSSELLKVAVSVEGEPSGGGQP